MDLFILMAQRKERYPGEYGFEALACMSEYGYDENPDYLKDSMEENRRTEEFDALAIVRLEVRGADIRNALYPSTKPVTAIVVP